MQIFLQADVVGLLKQSVFVVHIEGKYDSGIAAAGIRI